MRGLGCRSKFQPLTRLRSAQPPSPGGRGDLECRSMFFKGNTERPYFLIHRERIDRRVILSGPTSSFPVTESTAGSMRESIFSPEAGEEEDEDDKKFEPSEHHEPDERDLAQNRKFSVVLARSDQT